jgi:ribonucleoside-diphosphate reductase alpha chain
MTETASGATSRSGRKAHKGLTIQRIHTREGVHPYDEVTWERRDVVMTNWRDGTVNFEQHGVEFPDFWSVNAANIVTTKYFRGAVGTTQREWSLKQLVDRVVGRYTEAGRQHGYFATPKDAEIFDPSSSTLVTDLQLQLARLVQRRHQLPSAGLGVLHPVG